METAAAVSQWSRDALMTLLTDVEDPEIPVLNVVEMGIVRDARMRGEVLEVDITPTYSGCPAMRAIEDTIVVVMREKGFAVVEVNTVFDEPWTTDWMTDEAKAKLKAYGIAPPEPTSTEHWMPFSTPKKTVQCPHCNSSHTTLTSPFGSTACKALHYCNSCHQPFEYFKCI